MKEFRVPMVQHHVSGPDIEKNTELAIRYMKAAKEDGADFVLFPECFLTSYRML